MFIERNCVITTVDEIAEVPYLYRPGNLCEESTAGSATDARVVSTSKP
jgi:hypothetical protein